MNLHECLTLYTQEEVLSPEDTWYCSACQKHQQATKKFDLWRLPKVRLIIEEREKESCCIDMQLGCFLAHTGVGRALEALPVLVDLPRQDLLERHLPS